MLPLVILPGQRFGRLTVQGLSSKRLQGHRCYDCLCDCGISVTVSGSNLATGNSQSCGCLKREMTKGRAPTHGHKKGGEETRAYACWKSMLALCYRTTDKGYKNYGGRGISVCERWQHSFEHFYEDMGDPPPGMTIERTNNAEGYSPENCIWATMEDQSNNRRSNRLLAHNGKTQTVQQWSRELGIASVTILQRLNKGWDVVRALTQPIASKHRRA